MRVAEISPPLAITTCELSPVDELDEIICDPSSAVESLVVITVPSASVVTIDPVPGSPDVITREEPSGYFAVKTPSLLELQVVPAGRPATRVPSGAIKSGSGTPVPRPIPSPLCAAAIFALMSSALTAVVALPSLFQLSSTTGASGAMKGGMYGGLYGGIGGK